MTSVTGIRIGTSGWSYDHWAGVLYRPGLPVAKRLARYVEVFDTVELNASFYRWPRDATFAGWHNRLPADFTMSVKVHRGLSHSVGCRTRIPGWSGWNAARRPSVTAARRCWCNCISDMRRDDARLDHFLGLVPDWIRIAVEMRHPSWDDPAVYDLLGRHGAAYVVMSGPRLPCVLRATTDFVYVRMHGPDTATMYAGSYTPTTCAGGPSASGNGGPRTVGCWCTSTMTATATPCATPWTCGRR